MISTHCDICTKTTNDGICYKSASIYKAVVIEEDLSIGDDEHWIGICKSCRAEIVKKQRDGL